MKILWLMVCATCLALPSLAQRDYTVSDFKDFTKAVPQDVLNPLEQPLVVRSVKGFIGDWQGNPLPNALFEIQGPFPDKTMRRVRTDKNGTFKIRRVPQGSYLFKTTMNEFQSVVGTLIVSKKAEKTDPIKLKLPLGF